MQGEFTRPSRSKRGKALCRRRSTLVVFRRRQIANHEAFPLATSFLDKEQTKSGVSCQTICIPLMYRLGCHDY